MIVVLSNLVVGMTIWLAGGVPIILGRILTGRAIITSVVALWLHGSIVVG